jgi:hypothetical protein
MNCVTFAMSSLSRARRCVAFGFVVRCKKLYQPQGLSSARHAFRACLANKGYVFRHGAENGAAPKIASAIFTRANAAAMRVTP